MATSVGELSVKLGFDVDKNTLELFTKNIQTLQSNMLGLVGITGLTGAGIGAFARGTYDSAQSISSIASQTKIAANELQRYGAIANSINPSIDAAGAVRAIAEVDKAWNLYRSRGIGGIDFQAANNLLPGVGVGDMTSLQFIQALHEKYKGITDPATIQKLSQNLALLNLPPELVASITATDDKLKDASDKTALTSKEMADMAEYSKSIALSWASIQHSFMTFVNNPFIAKTLEFLSNVLSDVSKGDLKSAQMHFTSDSFRAYDAKHKFSASPSSSDSGGIAAQYKAAGFSDTAIAAIMGNLRQEDYDLSPSRINPKSGAYGLYQYLGSRKKALFARYGTNPTAEQQTQFAIDELKSGKGGAGRAGSFLLNGHGGLAEDTKSFYDNFEAPGSSDSTLNKRIGNAQKYATTNNIKVEINVSSNASAEDIAHHTQQALISTLNQTNNGALA